MKKTLIAVAVLAGFAGVAQAASNVTLYGIVDGGLHFNKTHFKVTPNTEADKKLYATDSRTTTFGIKEGVQKGNKFGLQGSEDLGNGVSAIFKLEGGFNITDGSSDGALFGKKAYLGLSGDAGTLTAGLQGNAVDELAPADGDWAKYDFFGDIGGASIQKGVKYVSPDLQGFQFAASWTGTNESTSSTGQDPAKVHNNAYALSFAYNLGSFSASTGISRSNDAGKPLTFIVGASYDFGPVAVFGRYGRSNVVRKSGFELPGQFLPVAKAIIAHEVKYKTPTATPADIDKAIADTQAAADSMNMNVNVLALAVSVPVSETGTFFANYQHAWVHKQVDNHKGKIKGDLVNLAYVEALSKQTSVSAYGGYKVEKGLIPGFGKDKLISTELAVGLTHKF